MENIEQMLAQLLTDRNNNDTIGSNHDEEKNLKNEHPKIENSKESSSIGVDVIEAIQAQIASLTKGMK